MRPASGWFTLAQPSANAYLVSKTRFLPRDRACRGGVARAGVDGIRPWFLTAVRIQRLNLREPRTLSKTGAVRVAGIAYSSSEGTPSSLVSRALRVPLGGM